MLLNLMDIISPDQEIGLASFSSSLENPVPFQDFKKSWWWGVLKEC